MEELQRDNCVLGRLWEDFLYSTIYFSGMEYMRFTFHLKILIFVAIIKSKDVGVQPKYFNFFGEFWFVPWVHSFHWKQPSMVLLLVEKS